MSQPQKGKTDIFEPMGNEADYWSRVIARAWTNDDFAQALQSDPIKTLEDHAGQLGAVPPGVKNTKVSSVRVPPRPEDLLVGTPQLIELTDEDGGRTYKYPPTCC